MLVHLRAQLKMLVRVLISPCWMISEQSDKIEQFRFYLESEKCLIRFHNISDYKVVRSVLSDSDVESEFYLIRFFLISDYQAVKNTPRS